MKGLLLTLYKILENKDTERKMNYQTKWQSLCTTQLSDGFWSDIWNSASFKSATAVIRSQAFRIIAFWYLTPQILAHANPTSNPTCWKNCGERGDYIHCWLFCPTLWHFWDNVLNTIQTITQQSLQFTPEHLLLGETPDEEMPRCTQDSISVMLSAARSAIALKWKTPAPPTSQIWNSKLWDHYIAAKLTLKLDPDPTPKKLEKFTKIWAPIIAYLEQQGEIPRDLTCWNSLRNSIICLEALKMNIKLRGGKKELIYLPYMTKW